MSQNINPYEAPQVEATVTPVVDVVFRVRLAFVIAGGTLGLSIVLIYEWIWWPDYNLWETFWNTYPWELSKGILGGMGVGIAVDSLWQKKFSHLAPGHWFLLLMVASLIAQYGTGLSEMIVRIPTDTTSFGIVMYFVKIATYFASILLLLTPILLTTREPPGWNMLLWCMLAYSVVVLLLFPVALFNQEPMLEVIAIMFQIASKLGSFALSVAIAILAVAEIVSDRPTAKPRDIYHWLGVFFTAGLLVLLIVVEMDFGFI